MSTSEWPPAAAPCRRKNAAGVLLDRAEQIRAQPRHVREQPLVRGLAQGEEEPDLADVDGQARPNSATPRAAARRALRPSGSPMSAEPITSRASSPTASRSGCRSSRRPAGASSPRARPGRPRRRGHPAPAVPRRARPRRAGGVGGEHPAHRLDALGRDRSHSFAQTGKVASSHSTGSRPRSCGCPRGTPWPRPARGGQPDCLGNLPALRFEHAWVACRTIACLATFLARSQLTGPPRQDSMSRTGAAASANCCGSPIARTAPSLAAGTAAAGPPPRTAAARTARPAALVFGLIGQAETERRSAIVGSAAGWKGHDRHVISEEAHCDKRAGGRFAMSAATRSAVKHSVVTHRISLCLSWRLPGRLTGSGAP